jgi:DNA-binding transcriptional MerR regulator
MNSQLLTVGGIAAETRVPAPTIRAWARRGLIECQRDSAGRRLFNQAVVAQVLKLRARAQRPAE